MTELIVVPPSGLIDIAIDYNKKLIDDRYRMVIFSGGLHARFENDCEHGINGELFVEISYHIFDDYRTLSMKTIKMNGHKDRYVYHVREHDIAQFLYDFVVNGKTNVYMLAKNWPKIKSSQYGASLHDIDIIFAKN